MEKRGNPSCWLFDIIPNNQKAKVLFEPDNESAQGRFNTWSKNILGNNISQLNYSTLRSVYVSSLNQFHIEYSSTYDGIADNQRKKIVEDLTRTLQKIRHDFNPNIEAPNEKEQKLFCAILRITLCLHYEKSPDKNSFKYRQSLIELILPIYHTVYYGLNSKDTYLVESVTKYLFKMFMIKTKHIQKIPGSNNFQTPLNDFENILSNQVPTACSILKKYDIQLMIPFKWYSLLFTHEFTFDIVIRIWDQLMEKLQCDKFNNILIRICSQILKNITNDPKNNDKQKIIQNLQDISKIDILSIMKTNGIMKIISNFFFSDHT